MAMTSAPHRLSDFEAAGPAGSPEAAIATGLIASCDTRGGWPAQGWPGSRRLPQGMPLGL